MKFYALPKSRWLNSIETCSCVPALIIFFLNFLVLRSGNDLLFAVLGLKLSNTISNWLSLQNFRITRKRENCLVVTNTNKVLHHAWFGNECFWGTDFSAVQVPRNGFQKRFGFQLLLWIRNIRMSIKIEKSNVGNADLDVWNVYKVFHVFGGNIFWYNDSLTCILSSSTCNVVLLDMNEKKKKKKLTETAN